METQQRSITKVMLIMLILSAIMTFTVMSNHEVPNVHAVSMNKGNAGGSANVLGGVARDLSELLAYEVSYQVSYQTNEKTMVKASYTGDLEDEIIDIVAESPEKQEPKKETPVESTKTNWKGPKLTRSKGVNQGPTGKETYYNLPMSGVVRIMRQKGFSESKYPYWVRNDGVKMLGQYVMVAANLSRFPRGSLVDCSLGKAIVCDTGDFARSNPTQLDIAVSW